ncbi:MULTISPECIES: deoxyguanosinetriphosphate triphosphohydrolase [Empedobacter]|uniref:Deoxyguanosinetriphosphate triphosphohydrolase n=1 Tax=Empedobacter falsenii TaxID=343874 RepID=A0A3R8US43_9FLAO|nr:MULTISPECIES: deoxyguanosinetriphosphate triphosphohydrolase [Empedobacter]MBW1617163.1 deoxyguanosinetriphosphate triphosphohydrolase [Empedobacter falsenii]MDH1602045.1 deoxyguanosinetriphosphate triphosphohydrolase [Empedobacter sp. GD03739]RRT94528.1 deoxyguanosinetriphosphate triphosphohydrolase [Empedobacter falsenii]RRT94774.1 deoxyguanosinetriphosphate triphosphohydrolase [Empedobacter falsenii]
MELLNHIYTNQRSNTNDTSDARSEYQRDYDRIIFSSAFRRLQNKTQVFPLPGSVFVHNRLTHSLEVSSVGRSMGNLVGKFISENYKLTKESQEFYKYSIHDVISAACLCHDIGNPAFGHSGEDAIASYFDRHEADLKQYFTEAEWADLINFEGNANAIRILTQQQNGKSEGGLRLTYSTLAAIAKYPCESVAKDKNQLHRKKFGFFQAQKEAFRTIAEKTNMILEQDSPIIYKRHPFVWLVEAADDICYSIIDVEDSQRLGIIDHDKCRKLFLNLVESLDPSQIDKTKNTLKSISDKNDRIAYLRAKSINLLTQKSVEVYQNNFDQIVKGEFKTALLDVIKNETEQVTKRVLDEIQRFSIENIYNHRSVLEIENAGYNVMSELLSQFIPPILKDEKERKTFEKKALRLVPAQFLYEKGTKYQKVMGILDYVSGMTDNYATELYRRIKGIEIGMTI